MKNNNIFEHAFIDNILVNFIDASLETKNDQNSLLPIIVRLVQLFQINLYPDLSTIYEMF